MRKPDMATTAAAFAIVICATLPLNAAELIGRYRVEGANAGGANLYRGEAMVVQSGKTYQVAWKVGAQEFRGTGVLTGTTFSVVLQPQGAPPALAVYQIHEDGSLVGVWTGIGGTSLGSELLKPEGRL